jgi:hypothetical protein
MGYSVSWLTPRIGTVHADRVNSEGELRGIKESVPNRSGNDRRRSMYGGLPFSVVLDGFQPMDHDALMYANLPESTKASRMADGFGLA